MYTGRRTIPLPPGWGAIRYAILARDPVCMWGMLPDEYGECSQPSTEVDHIGNYWDHSPEVLRGICHQHHLVRTSTQANAAKAQIRNLRKRPPDKHPGYIPVPAKEDPSENS
jgi:5-methylcytosine-specific restriction enzyme A